MFWCVLPLLTLQGSRWGHVHILSVYMHRNHILLLHWIKACLVKTIKTGKMCWYCSFSQKSCFFQLWSIMIATHKKRMSSNLTLRRRQQSWRFVKWVWTWKTHYSAPYGYRVWGLHFTTDKIPWTPIERVSFTRWFVNGTFKKVQLIQFKIK